MTNFALTASAAALLKLCLHKVPHIHADTGFAETQIERERGEDWQRLNVFKNNFSFANEC